MSEAARAKDLFLDALDLAPAEREAFLRDACGEDLALRAEVDDLLAAHGRADGVLGEQGTTPQSSAMLAMASRALAQLDELDLGPGDEVGDYRLEQALGEGGFGRVFRAEQLRPVQRRVALKLLKLGMDSGRVFARFEAERQVLARMEHPHITRVLDAGTAPDGRPFFVMELVDGEPITTYCRRRALSLDARLDLFRQVCLAIQHAHSKGVLHRDIKPNNVLVTEVDGEPQPRVIDFGVAKAIARTLEEGEAGQPGGGALTAEGHLVGTPAYMSPEQLDTAADVDTRSDVYALGVLLYELVAGAPPFTPEGTGIAALVDLRRQLTDHDATPPSRARTMGRGVAGAVPAEVDWITLRAIERDRERRYPTAAGLAAEVERLLAGLPVEAAPRSRFYRLRKLAQRHRAASLFAAAALLALVLGVLGTSVGMVRAGRLNVALGDALELAERETEEARAQSDIAEAVNDFLTRDLLSAARPSLSEGSGRDVMMSEVLDAAIERLDHAAEPGGRFADKPRVEGRVRHAIGGTLGALGRQEEARAQLDRAAALLAGELGDRHPEVLRCRLDRAASRYLSDRDPGAEAELLELMPVLREVLGPGDDLTLRAVELQGSMLHRDGQTAEAREVLVGGLAEARAAGKGGSAEAASLLLTLAMARADEGHLGEAEPLFREAIEVMEATRGPRSRETLVARANLGVLLARLGRQREGAEILEQVVPLLREALGDRHDEAQSAMVALATAWLETGRVAEAAELVRAAYEAVLAKYGEGHPRTLSAMDTLGIVLDAEGDFEGAREVMLQLVEASNRGFGAGSDVTAVRVGNLAVLLFEHGRCEEAAPHLRRALELNDAHQGRGSPFSVRLLSMQAHCARAGGDEVRAELLLLEGLERGAGLPAGAPALRDVREELALLCRDQERWEEAVELLEQNRDALREVAGTEDPSYLSTCARIVDVFVRAGWLDDARALEDELGSALDRLEDTEGLLRAPR